MSNQTIPISLQAVPVPVGIQAATIDQLLTVISQYISGSISADVSFFTQGASDPTQFVTPLFYNTNQNIFKGWDTGTGSYLPITEHLPGDTKNSFVDGDEISDGWIKLDGRQNSSVSGLSLRQQSILTQLFPSGTIPVVAAFAGLVGMPMSGAFSAVSLPDVNPPQNQIANLPFSGTYSATESQNLASNTETLRTSAVTINDGAKSIRDNAEKMLDALNGTSSTPLYAKVFIGYP